MERLTVLYDEHCAVCRRVRDWLLEEPTHVPLELLAAGSPAATALYGPIPWLGRELVVVADDGRVWAGPAAFLTVLWATVDYRGWSYRLAGRRLAPVAESFFRMVSNRRHRWARFIDDDQADCGWCQN